MRTNTVKTKHDEPVSPNQQQGNVGGGLVAVLRRQFTGPKHAYRKRSSRTPLDQAGAEAGQKPASSRAGVTADLGSGEGPKGLNDTSTSSLGGSNSTLDSTRDSSQHSLFELDNTESSRSSTEREKSAHDEDNQDDSSLKSSVVQESDDPVEEPSSNTSTTTTCAPKVEHKDTSFNSTFLSVGGSGKDCRQTGKGSIFVLADTKLGKTKVILSRLNKAATKIQRFFRYSMAVLSFHREELEYWREDLRDVKRRHQEELEEVKRSLEIQKKQFQLELERETTERLQRELDQARKVLEETRKELATENESHEELCTSIRKLKHENLHLTFLINDPEMADKVKELGDRIKIAASHKESYILKLDQLKDEGAELEERINVCRKEASKEQHKITVLKKYIDRINKHVPSGCLNADSEETGGVKQGEPPVEQQSPERPASTGSDEDDEPEVTLSKPTPSPVSGGLFMDSSVTAGSGDVSSRAVIDTQKTKKQSKRKSDKKDSSKREKRDKKEKEKKEKKKRKSEKASSSKSDSKSKGSSSKSRSSTKSRSSSKSKSFEPALLQLVADLS